MSLSSNKKIMKIILTLFFSFCSFLSFAQVAITGRVIDKYTRLPIEFAEVVLLNDKSVIVNGQVTDDTGTFKLTAPKGEYLLTAFFVGKRLFKENIVLSNNTDFGEIEVENEIALEQVIVSGKKKLITRKIDRLVFDVEHSSKSSAGDVLEVLKVIPGVRVQNNRLTLIGKSSLQVMVDDKIMHLSGDDLVNFLGSFASEDVKRIEVITSPPAKYDAAGNSGLINIQMKKTQADSWNAQVRTYYRQRKYPLGTIGGTFNFKKNKLSAIASINYRDGVYYQEQDDYTYLTSGVWHLSSPFKAVYNGLGSRIGIDYAVTPHWSMGGQYMHNMTNAVYHDSPNTSVYNNVTNNISKFLNSSGTIIPESHMNSFNYYNIITLDTLKRKIAIDFDYFVFINKEASSYEGNQVITETSAEQYYKGFNGNNQSIKNVSIKLDVDYPTSYANFNLGGKFSTSKSINGIDYYNSGLVNAPVQNMPLGHNDFAYNEDVEALYVSLRKKINDKLNLKLGVRMEATQTKSTSNALKLFENNDYVKYFPSFYLSYVSSENSTFGFSYSKRIQRPSFIQLNPNVIYINPFQAIEGNALLKPAYIDNLELTNTYGNLDTKIYFSHEEAMFTQVPLPNTSKDFILFTNQNYINRQRIGISENFTFDRIPWWASNNSIDINYSISKFSLTNEQKDQKGYNATLSSYNDFDLNKNKTLLAGINFWYEFPGVNGIFNKESASSLSFSLRYLLFNKNLNLSLRVNDVFKGAAERTTATINGIYQTARYYYDTQYFQVSASYKFGNKKMRVRRHVTGNEGEKNRTK